MAASEAPRSRREARAARARRARATVVAVVAGILVIGSGAALTAALTGSSVGDGAPLGRSVPQADAPTATGLPVPQQAASAPTESDAATAGIDGVCAEPAVAEALDGGADADVIAAVGGGEAFREAVASGEAPCLDLGDPERIWVVVNKLRPLDPLDFFPDALAQAEGVQRTSGGHMRDDVAAALSELASAVADEGAGTIGVNSGLRPYDYQVSTYNGYVGTLGVEGADRRSARPGHSEHQTGLAVDVVACSSGCGEIDAFGSTSQGDWLAENAWRFGFIVRYEDGATDTTGYQWEPWHLRYIGTDLAAAYHDGGFHTLEDFFGLAPAPDYAD